MDKGKLYIVATPIGNLSDMTFRAVEILGGVDVVAAEDTRNTLKLLNHFDIKKPLISYHEHNKYSRGREIIEGLSGGKNYALVSDAGMPAISDPGEDLVRLCHESGIEINVIPGASAVICAVAASGFKNGRFCFEGFLPVSRRHKKERLFELRGEKRTMVFYEAPHKLKTTLGDLLQTFGADRQIVIARELTKKFEETLSMTMGEAVDKYESIKPLGEFVLVVEGEPGVDSDDDIKELKIESARTMIDELRLRNVCNKDILGEVRDKIGLSRNEIYAMLLDYDVDNEE